MLDIWRYMFMMGMGALQTWFMRMRLGIVPVEFFITLPNLVTIPVQDNGIALIQQAFPNDNA